jgi:hypothetical protein
VGGGHWRGDGCVITPVDGRHSTHRALRYSIGDKLTVRDQSFGGIGWEDLGDEEQSRSETHSQRAVVA